MTRVEGDRWGEMMRAAIAGDAAIYRALLVEITALVRVAVRSALSRSGHGNADVEDIVQDILLTVHLKRGNWNQEMPFRPWLNAVVRHKIIDAFRRRRFAAHVDIDTMADALSAPEEPEPQTGGLEPLLQALNERQRLIVRGIAIEEKSTAQMALQLSMSVGAVRVNLHRALKHLARLYRGTER